MSKPLVIVESNAKTNKIQSLLENKVTVSASSGHIEDFDCKNLSINIVEQHDKFYFEPKYILKPESQINLSKFKKHKGEIIIATDKDREGEAIGYSLIKRLNLDKTNTKRIVFDEITKPALRLAINNPQLLNMNIVHAQQTRRMLDRIIGYMISPLLPEGLSSVGRVQTVAVKILRDNQIKIDDALEGIDDKMVFKIHGTFENDITARCVTDLICTDYHNTIEGLIQLSADYYVSEVVEYNKSQSPPKPYITSTLQQDASSFLKINCKTTMTVAQKLYESGYITYMRTDSVVVSDEFKKKIQDYIISNYGEQYLKKRSYKNKTTSQEAHECIRPTNLSEECNNMNNMEKKLYEMIWKRTVAAFMTDATYAHYDLKINHPKLNSVLSDGSYFFANSKTLSFDGFLKLYPQKDTTMFEIKLNEKLKLLEISGKEDYVYNESHYSESSLIKQLERLDIGRPSTYVSIIQKILDRKYVYYSHVEGIEKICVSVIAKVNTSLKGYSLNKKKLTAKIGYEKNKMVITPEGKQVVEWMEKHFSNFIDYKFTAQMETDLDNISEGNLKIQAVLNKYYIPLYKMLHKFQHNNDIPKKINNNNQQLIGQDADNNLYHHIKSKYGWCIKKQWKKFDKHPNYNCTFVSCDDSVPSIEQAIELSKHNVILGIYNRKPIIAKMGKHGWYLHYKKNIPTNNQLLTFDQAKELCKKA